MIYVFTPDGAGGKGLDEIAAMLGCVSTTVYRYLKKQTIKSKGNVK